MPNDEKMGIDERREYLKLVAPRYRKSNRAERSRLLTETGLVTGLQPQEPDKADGYAKSGACAEEARIEA